MPETAEPGWKAPCPRCGALVPGVSGPVHAYVPSSPGCWMTFGNVQADEMQRFGYPPAHRLVVDAYMAQHAGDGLDRRDRQSVFVHLVGLCAVLEGGMSADHTTELFRRMLKRRNDGPLLHRAPAPAALSVLHMLGTRDLVEYEARAREWAGAVWESWKAAHIVIRRELASAS